MAAKTLKEEYEFQKGLKREEVLKFMNSVSVTYENIFSNPKTLSKISEAIEKIEEIAEITKPLVPSLHSIVKTHSSILNESVNKNNSTEWKETLQGYNTLSELFKSLPEALENGEDLSDTLENVFPASLLNKREQYKSMVYELSSLPKEKAGYISSVFPEFPLVISEGEWREAVHFLLEENENNILLFEQADKMVQAIETLQKILNSLTVKDVDTSLIFPKTKIGLNSFHNIVQNVAATGKGVGLGGGRALGGEKASKQNEQKVLAQVAMVMSMFQALSNQWDNISKILQSKIEQIEKSTNEPETQVAGLEQEKQLQNSINLLRTMIVRRISVAGSGNSIINWVKKWSGKLAYPDGLTPNVIADDIINLIREEIKVPEKGTPTAAPPGNAPPNPTIAVESVDKKQYSLLEGLQHVKDVLNNLSQALNVVKGGTQIAAANLEKAVENVPSAAQTPASANQPTAGPDFGQPAPEPETQAPSAATTGPAVDDKALEPLKNIQGLDLVALKKFKSEFNGLSAFQKKQIAKYLTT